MFLHIRPYLHNFNSPFGRTLFAFLCLVFAVGIFLPSHAAQAATPTLVQHVSSGRDNTGGYTNPNLKITLPNAALANNALLLAVESDSGLTIGTPTDDKGNWWSAGPARTDTGQSIALFVATGVLAGTRVITVPFTGNVGISSMSAVVSEYYNVATTTAIDTSGSAAGQSINLTTAVDGDLIWQAGNDITTLDPNLTSITKGSGFTLLTANREGGKVAQYQVQGTHGAVTAAFTTSGSDAWQSVAIALKPGSVGTAPGPGIRIVHVQHELFNAATHTVQFPSTGNLLVGTWTSPDVTITAITDGNSNTWSTGVSSIQGGDTAQIFYAANATPGTDLTISPTYSGASGGDSFLVLFDVTGAAASPHDVDHTNSGNQTSAGNLTADTIAPTTPNGLVFNVTTIFTHTINGTVGNGYILVPFVNSGDDNGVTNASHLDEDDGRAIVYNAGTSPLTFVYTNTGVLSGVGVWESASMAFTSAPGAGIQVSSRSDSLSDSRPSATSNHTVAFTVNNAMYASSLSGSSTLVLTLPSGFTIPVGMNCGDVDAATSVQFSFNYPGCAATATAWGFSATGSSITLVPPSGTGVYVPTSTQVTIKIGSNATGGQQGGHWITNPSTGGVYTISVGGTFGGSGNMLVSINAGVTVQATVAESLSLSVSSIGALSCTADDGATITAIGTAPTSVPFGTVSANSFYQGCQDLVVSTNAGNGYSVTVQESSAMKTADGRFSIPDTTCDGGTCTESVAAAWTNATKNGLGHTCFNQLNHDCNAVYSTGTNFRQAADLSAGETAQSVMSSSTAATATGRVKYRLSTSAAQPAGTYTTVISYIITGTY